MTSPDFLTFRKLARKGNLVAVKKTVPADLETPVSSFLKLARKEPHAFLLESAEQGEKVGRYSIIGLEPEEIISSENGKIILRSGKKIRQLDASPRRLIDIMEDKMQRCRLANPQDIPGFRGGYVGYFAYENVEYFEHIQLSQKQGLNIPGAVFYLTQSFLVFDHFRKTLTFVVIVKTDPGKNLVVAYRSALRKISNYLHRLNQPLRIPPHGSRASSSPMQSNMTKRQYEKKVMRIRKYISAGDCIQVVLSQRFSMRAPRDDFQIYRALRSINPSPFMFYFRFGKCRLVGSSPELLVKNHGREAEVRPIAGTRPRGESWTQDAAYEQSLKHSVKEMAEHLMLVDLGRNDLGRVCEFNSVKVKNYARVERYSHVMHLVSDVTGRLKGARNSFDLLKATFPAGTVTGAPKIRAMQIIDELEPESRGAYAGCVGFLDFNRDMETCITIRTLVVDGNRLYLQAGAGIVKDSNPAREYQETVNKAKALLQAIEKQRMF